ncbi:hypothetical protein Pla86_11390 [Planctomycetes bacterium Pla86]|uniref:Uncharacterized protein n=2 Tax=Engelhardtia mirabilis TaxID=2528011 RepID=A0A518BGM6_9BACT|nr:hypothetical protein Pla133_11390 [Planctomycetes bacterium Pla133]QDV00400.1 hypothetical protein Pla86_11390 [Planctomycetes bacterium Pla86]
MADVAGGPAAAGAGVYVVPEGDELDPRDERIHDGSGELRIPVVGLSQRFDVHSSVGTITVDGPTVDGGEVVVELVQPAAAVTLSGRLVDTAGAPVAGEFFAGYAWRQGGEWREVTDVDAILVAADGRFSVDGAWRSGATAEARELRLRGPLTAEADGGWRYAAGSLPLDLSPSGVGAANVDVGELVVVGASERTEGSVLEAGGRPLSGMWVELRNADSVGFTIDQRRDLLGVAVTDELGHFSILHVPHVAGSEYFFAAASPTRTVGYDRSILAEVGSGGNRLELPDSAWVAMQIEAVGDVDLAGATLMVVQGDGASSHLVLPEVGRRVRLDLELEGEVDFRVLNADRNAILAQVHGVQLVRGESTLDGRLIPLVLGQGIGRTRVTIAAAEGRRAWPRISFSYSDGAGGEFEVGMGMTSPETTANVLHGPDAVALIVRAPGFFDRRLEPIEPDMRVELSPAGKIEFGAGELPSVDGLMLAPWLRYPGTNESGPWVKRDGDRFEFSPNRPGWLEVVWRWSEAETGELVAEFVGGELLVAETAEDQAFELPPVKVPVWPR